MKRFKKILMLVLVIFGPISFFYFLSRGEYYFKKLPFLHKENKGKPSTYNNFVVYDQHGTPLTPDSLKDHIVIVTYMDKLCPYKCKVDGKMFRLAVYSELVNAPGFKDVIILTEVNDSTKEGRKLIEESLEVDGKKWRFIYSKNFSFFNTEINKKNPYSMPDEKYKDGMIYERSAILLDKLLRIRGFIDSSGDIEFNRLMEEVRLLKKEYGKSKKVI